MPSYQHGGQCYSTQKSAALAWSVEVQSVPLTIGSSCTGVVRPVVGGTDSAPTVAWTWTRLSGTCAVPPTVNATYTATDCQLIDYDDASSMSWGVVIAWVVAWAVGSQLRKLVR